MKKLILIVALSVLCSSCAGPRKQSPAMSEEAQELNDEILIGREMAVKLIGLFGSYRKNQKAERYLNMVGHSIVPFVGRQDVQFFFAILDTDEVNIFGTPGGYVFVTRGLLRSLQTEDELAAMLAHEIAHINDKHMFDEIWPVAESRHPKKIDDEEIFASVNAGMKKFLVEGISASKEFEADIASAMYLTAIGYDSRAIIKAIARVDQERNSFSYSKVHPIARLRTERLQRFFKDNGIPEHGRVQEAVVKERFSKTIIGI